ncbi:NAD(P)/FAD-dependent oxidoreductase [Actinoplanes subtropicus]|uniref:NAD(P)/FAD-dependent oxidoreductase n=1 Tax=Actinoplanes subtropicus TaxID=543632 RepID=UPI0004C3AA16|nr:FAD-dependent oxidoreductase [Actinoplanes subtropicus]
MAVVVVGAGIAGLACARELVDAGVPARVLERDPQVGGRLASERLGGRWVDTGAAYLTADDPAFQGRLQTWRIDGLARPWTDTLRGQVGAATTRWAAPDGLRSLAEDLARELDVTLGVPVTSLPRADAVVLAMPGPQALAIADLGAARAQSWSPAVTAILTYANRSWNDFSGIFVNDHPVLSTVCDDGERRGDRAPVLVAHSTAAMAASVDPGVQMAKAVGELLGLGDPVSVETRHWPYASPKPGHGLYAREGHVYLCGDAFGRPRVQTAWLSGRAAARAILQSTD